MVIRLDNILQLYDIVMGSCQNISSFSLLNCAFPEVDISHLARFVGDEQIFYHYSGTNVKHSTFCIKKLRDEIKNGNKRLFVLNFDNSQDPDDLFLRLDSNLDPIKIERLDEFYIDDLLCALVAYGYERADNAYNEFTFAVRGDILDICLNADGGNGYRVVFDGNTVEKIIAFDIDSQKTNQNDTGIDNLRIYSAL